MYETISNNLTGCFRLSIVHVFYVTMLCPCTLIEVNFSSLFPELLVHYILIFIVIFIINEDHIASQRIINSYLFKKKQVIRMTPN